MFMMGSVLSFIYMLWLKLVDGVPMILTPMPVLTATLFLLSAITIIMGLLAEILVRTHFESQNRNAYHVRSTTNLSG